jgi:DNA-binding transcriptional LysR family regulator
MSDLIEFRHFKYILAVAETENITRAADRLFLAQPSLSKQIKDLEDDIGIPIFLRNREGVETTPAGQIIVAYAQDALLMRTETLAMARAVHRGEVPPLRLGFSSFIKSELLQMFRESYASMFPECEIQLAGGDPMNTLSRLEHGTLDAAFLPMPVDRTELIVREVSREPLVVCMRADDPLARESEVPLSVLATKLKIFRDPETHPSAHERLVEMLSQVGIKPTVSCLATTPADIHLMVRGGYGVALIEQSSIVDADLTTRAIAGVRWTADTAFVHNCESSHPALRVVARVLKKMTKSRLHKKTILSRIDMPLQLDLLA